MKQIFFATTVAVIMCSQSALAQSNVKNIYTENKTLNVEQVQNIEHSTQLNRYLIAGYNTLCLPVSLSSEQLDANGITVERLASIRQQGNTLQLLFVDCTAEGTEAGMPYLIFSPKTQYLRIKNTEVEHISAELKTVRMNDGQGNQVAFSSSWETKQKDGLYGIPAKQNVTPLESVLIRTNAEQSFLPTRCGFSWEQQSATAENIEIVHAKIADVTAIKTVILNNSTVVGDSYDLQGRKHNTPFKGINIINGNKVIVR